jgi:uncharacterized protein (DUF2141 family)
MSMTLLAVVASGAVASSPTLGTAEARCRPEEAGPAFIVEARGLRDRRGRIRLEAYPSNDRDVLADDNVLIAAGKVFRRVDEPVPAQGPVELCLRVPHPGAYSLSLLHDRDADRRFGIRADGVGFAGNPRLGLSKPRAAAARAVAGPGLTRVPIVLNYRHGIFFRPQDH